MRRVSDRTNAADTPLFRRPLRFDGPDYEPAKDRVRLTGQLERIVRVVRDGGWRTLAEIAAATGDPEASISAQLRHLRKPRFGSHTVERARRGNAWYYRVQMNPRAGNTEDSGR